MCVCMMAQKSKLEFKNYLIPSRRAMLLCRPRYAQAMGLTYFFHQRTAIKLIFGNVFRTML